MGQKEGIEGDGSADPLPDASPYQLSTILLLAFPSAVALWRNPTRRCARSAPCGILRHKATQRSGSIRGTRAMETSMVVSVPLLEEGTGWS
jgi:hypothetical protein